MTLLFYITDTPHEIYNLYIFVLMQLSVIILNYNVRYFLEQCVLSVQHALVGIDGEIIVVDNNSSDDSCAMMKECFPDVKLIENQDNVGFPRGNNIGVKCAKGKYICILNPDTVVPEDIFQKVLPFAEKEKNLGGIGVKLIDGTGHFLPESKRGIPTPWVAATKITGLYRMFAGKSVFAKYYAGHLGENETGEVEILVGAFMIIERQLYIDVDGFDEDCFMYSDDIDLSYIFLKKGRKNFYFHEASVIHYKGESTIKDGLYMKRFREAMQFFYAKHFRRSRVFDLFMRMGAMFFMLIKKNRKGPVVNPEGYVLISGSEALRNMLEKQLQKKVERLEKYNRDELSSLNGKEVVFDNEAMSFCAIIAAMEELRDCGLTFKIKPAGCSFIIGSNSSNDRGEVVVLDNYHASENVSLCE